MAGDQVEAAEALRDGWRKLAAGDDASVGQAERLAKAALALIKAQEALATMQAAKDRDGVMDDAEIERLKARLLERLDRLAIRLEEKRAAGGDVAARGEGAGDGVDPVGA